MKKYLKNLWNDLVNDESGQYGLPGYPSYAPSYVPPKKSVKARAVVPVATPKTSLRTPPSAGLYGTIRAGAVTPTVTKKVTQPSLTSAITGAVTPQPIGGITGGVAGGGQFPLESFPKTPDITAGLSSADIARLESEAGMLSELGFSGAFRQLGQNLIESKRIATEEREEAVPIYEKSMRDVAATVANAIGNWAQKLNQLGMLRSGSYGRGISRLETAGVAERGGLQQALNERLEDISTREADYERDVLDLRAGLEKEKGLQQSTTFERLKREELVYQRDTRQMQFQNEVQRATFVNTMNQMIWQRDMAERQLKAQQEAQMLENQMLRERIKSLYGAGTAQGVQVPGVGTLTPGQAFEYGYAPMGEYAEQDPYVEMMREYLGLGGAQATPYTPGGAFPGATGSAAGFIR